MIHPYQGYLAAMSKHMTFTELETVYENQVVSSLERSTGRDLLAEELSCLSLWLAYSEKSSFDDYSEFKGIMEAFRFTDSAQLPTAREFKREFAYLLHKEGGHGELSQVSDSKDDTTTSGLSIFRFDLVRRIFL